MLDHFAAYEEEPFALVANGAAKSEPSYLLQRLEVYNWGPFRGLHRAEFDPLGTAIIGPTGSGKTTLVDAIMTLLVGNPRYNLASTGGHESDRTLIEYVRGVLGGDGSDNAEKVARPGKTITGICATYLGGEQTVRLAALLWTEGSGNAADDLKKRWIFSTAEEQTLEKWLTLLNDDGLRELLRMGRETADLRIFESKKNYLVQVRKFFDVGDNAFTLLNRAAGLKQLNSIDEIFRELVLDDRSAFERAIEVAAEFDNLAGIHAELETARKQQESLLPVAAENEKLLKARRKWERTTDLKRILPIWFSLLARQKWSEEVVRLTSQQESLQAQLKLESENAGLIKERVEVFRERYLELGGNVIGELENSISYLKEIMEDKRKNAQQYRQLIARFQLPDELSEHALLSNQAQLREQRLFEQHNHDQQQEKTLRKLSELREQENRLRETESRLRKVKERPGSNIPPQFQDFRAELARHLALREADLPFLAELVEVKVEEAEWRGAIERAMGSERLRILVPEKQVKPALRWVNDRDNRLHVRLFAAGGDPSSPSFFHDGFVRKLNFKQHASLPAAKQLLAKYDRHCVSSPELLQTTEHALTVQGTMSGSKGKFEKQDQKRIDQDWLTGFDNKDQLEAIAKECEEARIAVSKLKSDDQILKEQLSKLAEQLRLIDAILTLDFAKIDLPKAAAELARSQERLAALLDPRSDASQARTDYEREDQRLEAIRQAIAEVQRKITIHETNLSNAEFKRVEAQERVGHGLTEEETNLAGEHIKLELNLPAQKLDAEERRFAKAVEDKLSEQQKAVADIEVKLVQKMGSAKHVDTGALTDVGSNLDDVPYYLERLRVLNEEALPEKRSRFLEYLNRSSDQGVTQLLASIDEEVDAIEQRIQELNHTLVKVDFRSGRYLQLQPQRMKDERLRTLDVAMRKVRSAALKDDGGESHYRALQEMVAILREASENRRQLGSKALLDPRFRLQFFVVEVDRLTGSRSSPRTGSQSGSGGEKELMASHILTASLSYALCPPAASRPLYGTVILDEAFSKSSPSAASRIIEALRIFNLHPIFVTPNKEIGLLKQHTRKVICVQRPGKEASLASISWEILEKIARP
jgi:uncharacterized protein YPO0396